MNRPPSLISPFSNKPPSGVNKPPNCLYCNILYEHNIKMLILINMSLVKCNRTLSIAEIHTYSIPGVPRGCIDVCQNALSLKTMHRF